MGVSNRTISLLASPFEGGDGPSHSVVRLVWTAAGAAAYLPDEGNKLSKVLLGLRSLEDGNDDLEPDHDKLRLVVADLAERLLAANFAGADLEKALAKDGLGVVDGEVVDQRPTDEPADEMFSEALALFGGRSEFDTARNHFEQAGRAFDRSEWESANGQFRSAFEATFDALALAHGCPSSRSGGAARKWLQNEGLLEEDTAELIRSFASFAGRAGSHAGLSDATDAQLRRHFASSIIAFGIAKLG